MARQISSERKGSYYLGLLLMIFGGLLFGYVFLYLATSFGDSGRIQRIGSIFPLAILGMGIIAAGSIFMNIGRRGLAGSGVILNPERARQDVEPWSRMGGGMVKDALDEAGISLGDSGHRLAFDDELRRLHKLREEKIISDAEYEAKKKQILERT